VDSVLFRFVWYAESSDGDFGCLLACSFTVEVSILNEGLLVEADLGLDGCFGIVHGVHLVVAAWGGLSPRRNALCEERDAVVVLCLVREGHAGSVLPGVLDADADAMCGDKTKKKVWRTLSIKLSKSASMMRASGRYQAARLVALFPECLTTPTYLKRDVV
jgi:hypothetical protein